MSRTKKVDISFTHYSSLHTRSADLGAGTTHFQKFSALSANENHLETVENYLCLGPNPEQLNQNSGNGVEYHCFKLNIDHYKLFLWRSVQDSDRIWNSAIWRMIQQRSWVYLREVKRCLQTIERLWCERIKFIFPFSRRQTLDYWMSYRKINIYVIQE